MVLCLGRAVPYQWGKLKRKKHSVELQFFYEGLHNAKFLCLELRMLSFTRSFGYESREFRSKMMPLEGMGLKSYFGALKEKLKRKTRLHASNILLVISIKNELSKKCG